MNQAIGLNLRKIREQKHLSQAVVAKKMNMSQGAYSNIENGKTYLKPERLIDLAKALDVNVQVLKLKDNSIKTNKTSNPETFNKDKFDQLFQEIIIQYKKRIIDLEEIIRTKDEVIKLLKSSMEK